MAFKMLLNYLLNPQEIYPYKIEKLAASISAPIIMPEPDSGNLSMRFAKFPLGGSEAIIDIYTCGKRVFITVTRFLASLRVFLDKSVINPTLKIKIPIEISTLETNKQEPLFNEVFFRNRELAGNLSESENDDHYFLFKTDSINCFVYGISNPCIKKDESWIRLINRSFGTELVPPRRKFVEKLVYK